MHTQPARKYDIKTRRPIQLSIQVWLQEATAQFAAAQP